VALLLGCRLDTCGVFLVLGLTAVLLVPVITAGQSAITVKLSGGAPNSLILPDAERRLTALVNRERRAHGLSPLIPDASLQLIARQHAQEMAMRGYVGHGSAGGQTLRARFARYLRPGTRIGENVAMVRTIDEGHRAFIASPAHLENMLDPGFRRVGIGVTTAGAMDIMITEEFAGSVLTGAEAPRSDERLLTLTRLLPSTVPLS
jgi:uncharacterized protein YkwD